MVKVSNTEGDEHGDTDACANSVAIDNGGGCAAGVGGGSDDQCHSGQKHTSEASKASKSTRKTKMKSERHSRKDKTPKKHAEKNTPSSGSSHKRYAGHPTTVDVFVTYPVSTMIGASTDNSRNDYDGPSGECFINEESIRVDIENFIANNSTERSNSLEAAGIKANVMSSTASNNKESSATTTNVQGAKKSQQNTQTTDDEGKVDEDDDIEKGAKRKRPNINVSYGDTPAASSEPKVLQYRNKPSHTTDAHLQPIIHYDDDGGCEVCTKRNCCIWTTIVVIIVIISSS